MITLTLIAIAAVLVTVGTASRRMLRYRRRKWVLGVASVCLAAAGGLAAGTATNYWGVGYGVACLVASVPVARFALRLPLTEVSRCTRLHERATAPPDYGAVHV
jgi:hypothetical protein